MRKLVNNGQAILCTIHQPSAILMQEFDRLLFLAAGGRTVYFGEVGENCTALTRYFESHGAHPCPPQTNPAEWMLEVIGAAPGHHSDIDWHKVWCWGGVGADVVWCVEFKRVCVELGADPTKRSHASTSGK